MSVNIVSSDSEADVAAAIAHKPGSVDKAPKVTLQGESASTEVVEKVESEPTKEAKSEEPPKKDKVQKRIDTLTKRNAEAERRAAYWEQEAKRKQAEVPVQPKVEAADKSKEPSPDDFDKHSDYVKALVRFEADQRDQVTAQKTKEKEFVSQVENERKSFSEKEKEFQKSTPDYKERLEAVNDVEMSFAVRDRILKGGPELAYAMTEDPEEFKRICALSPSDAIEEIGEIKARVKAAAKMKIEEKSENKPKPKPITPVGSKVSPDANWEKMSTREYDAWRRAGNSPKA